MPVHFGIPILKGNISLLQKERDWCKNGSKPAEKISVGDVIYCPPGVKHWHGASGNSAMTHLALTATDEHGKNVDWLEPVSDEQYKEAGH